MTRTIWSATCAVLVGIVTVAISAQAPPTQTAPPQAPTTQAPPPTQAPPAPPPPAADRGASAENKVTVTGCLTPAPPAPTGTAGSADAKGDPASDVKFLLTNAAASSSAPGASSGSSAARTYRLIANETALSPHSGKKLELTGTLEGQEGSPSAGAAPDASSKAQSSGSAPKLRVESGKIVAPQCNE
jgi:hypothetical protein